MSNVERLTSLAGHPLPLVSGAHMRRTATRTERVDPPVSLIGFDERLPALLTRELGDSSMRPLLNALALRVQECDISGVRALGLGLMELCTVPAPGAHPEWRERLREAARAMLRELTQTHASAGADLAVVLSERAAYIGRYTPKSVWIRA